MVLKIKSRLTVFADPPPRTAIPVWLYDAEVLTRFNEDSYGLCAGVLRTENRGALYR